MSSETIKALVSYAQHHFELGQVTDVHAIQSLWGGQGQIVRATTANAEFPAIVIKHVCLDDSAAHPRGWQSGVGFARKKHSYEVEAHWYKGYSSLCSDQCRVPRVLGVHASGHEHFMLLEDLSLRYPQSPACLSPTTIKSALLWLANLHAQFMGHDADGLWPVGSYWHLQTRQEEFDAMHDGPLKHAAQWLDDQLQSSRFQTVIHGDAKLANALFSDSMRDMAMVDFQYTGRGVGVRDLVVMLASALTDEQCDELEQVLLDYYFKALADGLAGGSYAAHTEAIEKQWRYLYPLAWADYHRFLAGWMPEHSRINRYTEKNTQRALQLFQQQ